MSNQNNSQPPSNPQPQQQISWNGNLNGGQWVTISIPYTNITPTTPVLNVPEMCEEPPVRKKKDKDGETCKKCLEFYPFAEPNQEDGTLVCYSCRHGY